MGEFQRPPSLPPCTGTGLAPPLIFRGSWGSAVSWLVEDVLGEPPLSCLSYDGGFWGVGFREMKKRLPPLSLTGRQRPANSNAGTCCEATGLDSENVRVTKEKDRGPARVNGDQREAPGTPLQEEEPPPLHVPKTPVAFEW